MGGLWTFLFFMLLCGSVSLVIATIWTNLEHKEIKNSYNLLVEQFHALTQAVATQNRFALREVRAHLSIHISRVVRAQTPPTSTPSRASIHGLKVLSIASIDAVDSFLADLEADEQDLVQAKKIADERIRVAKEENAERLRVLERELAVESKDWIKRQSEELVHRQAEWAHGLDELIIKEITALRQVITALTEEVRDNEVLRERLGPRIEQLMEFDDVIRDVRERVKDYDVTTRQLIESNLLDEMEQFQREQREKRQNRRRPPEGSV